MGRKANRKPQTMAENSVSSPEANAHVALSIFGFINDTDITYICQTILIIDTLLTVGMVLSKNISHIIGTGMKLI